MAQRWQLSVGLVGVAAALWWGWVLPEVGELHPDERADALPLATTPGTRFALVGTVWPVAARESATPTGVGAEPGPWLIRERVEVNPEGPDDIRARQRPPFVLRVGETRLLFAQIDYRVEDPPSREDLPQEHFFAQQRYWRGFRVGDPARVEGEVEADGRPVARRLTAGPARLRDPAAPPLTITVDDRAWLEATKLTVVVALLLWAVVRLRGPRAAARPPPPAP